MSELYHYGVKGMKWGVRKKIKDYRDRGIAKSVLKSHIRDYKTKEKVSTRYANKEQKRYEKFKVKGDVVKAQNHQVESVIAKEMAKQYIQKRLKAETLLSEIKNKSVEAGKDFLVKQEIGFGKLTRTVEDTKRKTQYKLTTYYR